MKIKLSQSEICLSRRQTLSLADPTGVRIAARAGVIWVTQDHDLRDAVLQPGEAIAFERPGRVIVQALAPARIALSQSRPSRHSKPRARRWFEGLSATFKRLRPPQLAWA